MARLRIPVSFGLNDAAEYVGLARSTWRDYTLRTEPRRRGPAPDFYDGPHDPRWYLETLDAFKAEPRIPGRKPGVGQCAVAVIRGSGRAEACHRDMPCPVHP